MKTYEQLIKQVTELEESDNIEEATALLADALEKFPDEGYPITEKLGELYTQTQQYEKALEIWAYGAARGFFYCHNPGWPIYEPYTEFEQFEALVEKDRQLREEAIKIAQTQFEVVTPQNYASDQQYPLLLVFHGGNSRINMAKPYWNSEQLNNGFLVAFIQSYLHYGMDKFGWKRSDQRAWDDIKNGFAEITKQYSVDTANVFTGGISAGGLVAIEMALTGTLDVSGFIGVCPVIPGEDILNSESVAMAKENGQRAVIISGEEDTYTGPQAQKMADAFEEAGFSHQLVIVPEMGHEYPDDFATYLDAALAYLQK
jgi:predicted esterase